MPEIHPVERLNNAILDLEWRARSAVQNKDVMNSITQLSIAWVAWYEAIYRQTYVVLTPAGSSFAPPFYDNTPIVEKFGRFVAWYARAYVLVPSEFRKTLLDPRDFDDYEAEIARREIARVLDALGASADVTTIATTDISKAARELLEELKEGAKKAASGIGQMMAGVGVAWLVISVFTNRTSRAR
jgi:hypothetical protein